MEKSKNKKNYIISYILVAVLGFLVGLALYLWQLDFYHARGESPPNFLTSFFGENKAQNTRIGSISESQIMQRLVDAASERLTAIKAYESIPKNQLDNLSYEDFDQYINRLKRVYKNSPISFTPMNHKEKQLTLLSISKTSPDLAEQATQAAFFWLEPDSVYGDNVKLPILLQKQSDGTAYISSLWVKNCLEIYSYSELYFSAIDRADVKMLSALLSSASDKEEIRLKKAEQTIQYYKDEIQGNFNDYDIVSWRIDGMVLRQNLINASENNSAFSNIASAFQDLAASQSKRAANARFVYVLAVEPHVWQLRDVIPQSYVANDFSFVLPNAASIAPGDIVDKDYLHELFGELLALQDNRKTETTPSDKAVTQLISEGAGKIVALYNGAHIILDDPLIDPGSGYFSGKINTITILSADGKQGSGLKIGDGVEQILQNYPFLDLNSYTGIDERKALYFMLMVRGGKVMAMRSGILPEGGDSTLQLFNRDLNSSVGGLPTPAPTLTPTPIPSPTPKPSPKPSAKASSKPAPSPSPKP